MYRAQTLHWFFFRHYYHFKYCNILKSYYVYIIYFPFASRSSSCFSWPGWCGILTRQVKGRRLIHIGTLSSAFFLFQGKVLLWYHTFQRNSLVCSIQEVLHFFYKKAKRNRLNLNVIHSRIHFPPAFSFSYMELMSIRAYWQ